MKLAEVLSDAKLDARHAGLEVSGVSADSRKIRPGDLFVAVSGAKADGLRFVPEAVAAGAVAVLAERMPAAPLPQAGPLPPGPRPPPPPAPPPPPPFPPPPGTTAPGTRT